MAKKKRKGLTREDMMYVQMVANIMSIDIKLLTEKSRRDDIVKFRQFMSYILRKHLRYTLYDCAFKLKIDHATVLHGIKEVQKLDEIVFPPYNDHWRRIKNTLHYFTTSVSYLTWNYCNLK